MNLSAVLFLIGTIIMALAAMSVQLGAVPMVTTALTLYGAGLFFESTTWNRPLH